ncbi:sulfotransferase family 2 domain-containing protein [Pelagicoccus albus]|uniref:Sulfotransferase family 2 domain-containing protein n=1 Tax=Pelagicoccus albus TaxID=415222 RepID=A0A7X1B3F2_9BACT|nr:sulfotransferase family 2 domain-containing protein [Pelagicoccus albus]MBC2604934.1 sulfotransferase family 2 domain-containing protein [Pelagicoccus albus]
MLISHGHNFLFIHICKTAGSSIQRALQPYAEQMPKDRITRLRSKIGLVRDPRKTYFPIHADWNYARKRLGAERYHRMYKFAFVRNPFDLLVSSYHYIRKNKRHHRHAKVTALGSFSAFVDYEIQRDKLHQSRAICDKDGNLMVDFVGRFESLPDDFKMVCRQLGLKAELPHENASSRSAYQSYYDEKLRDKVEEFWSEDLQRFGYSYQG